MHVIAKPALVKFWTKYPDAEKPLMLWFRTMKKEAFRDFVHLRQTFSNADYVNDLIVFNIGGNKYRLIADIRYDRQKAYVLHILTHAEYSRNNWRRRN